MRRAIVPLVILSCFASALGADEVAPPAGKQFSVAQYDFFEKNVRPLLVKRCYDCHSGPADEVEAGLSLESRAGVLTGGEHGPAAVAGRPEESLLIRAIGYGDELQMPPTRKLPAAEIAHLVQWVRMALPWPRRVESRAAAAKEATVEEIRGSHWAFQRIRRPELPPVRDARWGTGPVDRFVRVRLEAAGLEPSPRADRVTLARRATFDLTGLPPTPQEVADFLRDRSPGAFAKLVDRLLDSPRYGERWGRHWLDVARYADTKGYAFQRERRYPFSYTYRDYVIRALNDDLPYDRFILEQLAADLLPKSGDDRMLAGLGYLTVGRKFNRPHLDIDDQIDVVTRGLMGLTVACARCHDHKYEAIPTEDYYSLYGVFASSKEPDKLPLIGNPASSPGYEAYRREHEKLEQVVRDFLKKKHAEYITREGVPANITVEEVARHLDRADRNEYRKIERKVQKHEVESAVAPPRAMVLVERQKSVEPHVFVRGDPRRRGKAVPRQFLRLLSGGRERRPFASKSGRLELAHAIVDPGNPLTARVMVNRVWMHHFGEPLVTTPSDFGVRSQPPSHPRLLDYLAWSFKTTGWSLKRLHRQIMLSESYQQESVERPECVAVDPENRLLWRMNRRRLEFEAMRDAVLAVSGKMDTTIGGRPTKLFTSRSTERRTIYGFIDRQDLPNLFRVFDFANPDQTSARRPQTTVPQQALFLMNSRFIREQAEALVARAEIAAAESEAGKVEALYRILLSRRPTHRQIASSVRFLRAAASDPTEKKAGMSPVAQLAQVLLSTNEFQYVD